jgi:hypothetical protein
MSFCESEEYQYSERSLRRALMTCRSFSLHLLVLPLLAAAVAAQVESSNTQGSSPVSYASVSAMNVLLGQLQQAVKSTRSDLSALRVEKWKTGSSSKRQVQDDVDSIQRNLQEALPAILGELQASPESLTATFKLYRNLDALYDVFTPVVESAGAFGSEDEFQSLANDLNQLEKVRHSLGDRLDILASAKESELARLRVEVRAAQAAVASQPPKRIIIDDTQPEKKPVHKRSRTKAKPKPASNAQENKQQ